MNDGIVRRYSARATVSQLGAAHSLEIQPTAPNHRTTACLTHVVCYDMDGELGVSPVKIQRMSERMACTF